MASKNSNTNNKSLYLYTSLIFVVAILLIILSFFAMSNRDRKMNETEQAQSITEKSSILSEENKNLAEENINLKTENSNLTDKILSAANDYYIEGNTEKVNELINGLNTDNFSEEQKEIYNTITGQKAE